MRHDEEEHLTPEEKLMRYYRRKQLYQQTPGMLTLGQLASAIVTALLLFALFAWIRG